MCSLPVTLAVVHTPAARRKRAKKSRRLADSAGWILSELRVLQCTANPEWGWTTAVGISPIGSIHLLPGPFALFSAPSKSHSPGTEGGSPSVRQLGCGCPPEGSIAVLWTMGLQGCVDVF